MLVPNGWPLCRAPSPRRQSPPRRSYSRSPSRSNSLSPRRRRSSFPSSYHNGRRPASPPPPAHEYRQGDEFPQEPHVYRDPEPRRASLDERSMRHSRCAAAPRHSAQIASVQGAPQPCDVSSLVRRVRHFRCLSRPIPHLQASTGLTRASAISWFFNHSALRWLAQGPDRQRAVQAAQQQAGGRGCSTAGATWRSRGASPAQARPQVRASLWNLSALHK